MKPHTKLGHIPILTWHHIKEATDRTVHEHQNNQILKEAGR